MLKNKLVIVAATLFIALGLTTLLVFNLYRDAAASEAAGEVIISELMTTIAYKESALESAQRALESKEKLLKKTQIEADTWKRKWKEVKQNDPICKEWADSILPGCAIEQLRKPESSNNANINRATS